ncbi:LOW QUALITY PROTEIN: baculoviral IAP repeat-containing protein 6-like [Liolophura sinensis]|uniref:LOW QUALITY PROTEIN: baculoviral IAP repeat-containing protein 6-like n=1 Tax=Liolophura sinensis TaxID=3198878 RepID=UPI0031581A97
MKKAKLSPGLADYGAYRSTSQEKKQAQQIFTSSAASGILTNDLVRIMEEEQDKGFSAEPVDDNIYMWKVKLFNFEPNSDVDNDLKEIETKYGYNYIELELTFDIDLYPFFPPLVKVIRPRLQGALMQRVTNMEMLKLSYWSPTKDMRSVIHDVKHFLQQWARLEMNSERNDPKKYPQGSYVGMEHHLLRLALVSEVNPRANLRYQMDADALSDLKPMSPPKIKRNLKESKVEYWAAGVGFGHNQRPEWDINAYLAAQIEKDKQIEAVLHQILQNLRILYAHHAPQLKPRPVRAGQGDAAMEVSTSVDPVEDMFNILESSALIPFIEQYLQADSFLEIARHKVVYKAIIDILKEIAMQSQLVRLVCALPSQHQSIYQLLERIEEKASIILQHIGKVGNGSVPKPQLSPLEDEPDCVHPGLQSVHKVSDMNTSTAPPHSSQLTEERLARDFATLFKDVKDSLKRNGISEKAKEPVESSPDSSLTVDVMIHNDEEALLEAKYKRLLKDLVLDSHEIDLEAHHYVKLFQKNKQPLQSQVFRIAQEITSLSTSLPLTLSSSIFVRTDDEKLPLMRALITGPEGTPYSGGCFHFDIFFPNNYPNSPPQVNLQTTGGGTVRFNPNLYGCGKVCLSLLGTWEGQKGEQWNAKASTILQVLVSIQSLILVPDPYFNEPGFEQEIGTAAGKLHSEDYNADVRINNIRYAMIGQLHNPTPGFEEVIKTHFYLKRERIIKEAEGWLKNCKKHYSKLERAIETLKQELSKLEAPPNVTNLSSNSEDSMM